MHPADQLGRGAAEPDGEGWHAGGVSPLIAVRQAAIGCAAVAVLIAAAIWALVGAGWIRVLPGPPRPAPAEPPAGPGLAVPVAGVRRADIRGSWGDPRDNGRRAHHGTDIIAPAGTPVIAVAPGTVEKLFQSVAGGTTLYVRSPDRRTVYYYAHLSRYATGMREGLVVKTGDPLGVVGDTGNAGAGNYQLHFGVALTRPDQRWHEGVDIDPYPLLAGQAPAR